MSVTVWCHRANGSMFYVSAHDRYLFDWLLIGGRLIRDVCHDEGTRGEFMITEIEFNGSRERGVLGDVVVHARELDATARASR